MRPMTAPSLPPHLSMIFVPGFNQNAVMTKISPTPQLHVQNSTPNHPNAVITPSHHTDSLFCSSTPQGQLHLPPHPPQPELAPSPPHSPSASACHASIGLVVPSSASMGFGSFFAGAESWVRCKDFRRLLYPSDHRLLLEISAQHVPLPPCHHGHVRPSSAYRSGSFPPIPCCNRFSSRQRSSRIRPSCFWHRRSPQVRRRIPAL